MQQANCCIFDYALFVNKNLAPAFALSGISFLVTHERGDNGKVRLQWFFCIHSWLKDISPPVNTSLSHARRELRCVSGCNVKRRDFDMIPGSKIPPGWTHYSSAAADRKQGLKTSRALSAGETRHQSPWLRRATRPHSWTPSPRDKVKSRLYRRSMSIVWVCVCLHAGL